MVVVEVTTPEDAAIRLELSTEVGPQLVNMVGVGVEDISVVARAVIPLVEEVVVDPHSWTT